MQMSSKSPLFFWLLKEKKKKIEVLNQKLAFAQSRWPARRPAPMLILMQRGGQRSVSVICSGKACRIFTELCDPVGHSLCVCDHRQNGIGTREVAFSGYQTLFSGAVVPGAWRAHVPAAPSVRTVPSRPLAQPAAPEARTVCPRTAQTPAAQA